MVMPVNIVVDVESDGPCPGLYSMISLGAVVVKPPFDQTFFMQAAPVGEFYDDEALAVSGITHEEHLIYPDAMGGTLKFFGWLQSLGDKPVMWSDNPAYDWQWVNYYLHRYAKKNPLGWSARRIGDLYCGVKGDLRARWKHLRTTAHTHHPVDDAKGNAEALWKVMGMMGKA